MKASVITKFGPPEVLQLKEVEKPIPKDNEVLVKVHAASINYIDWQVLRGESLFLRLTTGGLLKPKHTIPGGDIAGRVEAVGRNVKQFQPGDEIFGDLGASRARTQNNPLNCCTIPSPIICRETLLLREFFENIPDSLLPQEP